MNESRTTPSGLKITLLLIAFSFALASSTVAQTSMSELQPERTQVVSANPFGLLLNVFNAEYERVIGESATAGIGGSSFFGADDPYVNADVFWRYYPQGNPLDGFTFGVKVGLTHVGDEGTFFGAGFDLNQSWVMGKNNNFYAGIGFGLKRMFVSNNATFDLEYIPTFRIINIGKVF